MGSRVRRWTESWISKDRHALLNGKKKLKTEKERNMEGDMPPLLVAVFYIFSIVLLVGAVYYVNRGPAKLEAQTPTRSEPVQDTVKF